MDPLAGIVAISLIALVAAVGSALNRRSLLPKKVSALEAARARSQERAKERQFADTLPGAHVDDGLIEYNTSVDGLSVTQTTGDIPLTEDQLEAMILIFEGYNLPPIHRPRHGSGSNVLSASGVPSNLTAFDWDNRVPTR